MGIEEAGRHIRVPPPRRDHSPVTTTGLPPTRPAKLATEADVLQTLRYGTYTLAQIYAACEEGCDVARDGGLRAISSHPGGVRWRPRVRGELQTPRPRGRAGRLGHTVWDLQGTHGGPDR